MLDHFFQAKLDSKISLKAIGNRKSFSSLAIVLSGLLQSVASFAQEAAAPQSGAQQPPAWMQFVPMVVVVLIFYFLILRPQAKRQKDQQALLSGLKAGDQVVTQSGVLGRIDSLDEKIVHLQIAQGVSIKVLRSTIAGLQTNLK